MRKKAAKTLEEKVKQRKLVLLDLVYPSAAKNNTVPGAAGGGGGRGEELDLPALGMVDSNAGPILSVLLLFYHHFLACHSVRTSIQIN